eukprot:8862100-Prorocentrum_lima.AAC.1
MVLSRVRVGPVGGGSCAGIGACRWGRGWWAVTAAPLARRGGHGAWCWLMRVAQVCNEEEGVWCDVIIFGNGRAVGTARG